MFFNFSLKSKKKTSLLVVCVIFISCFSITTFESNKTYNSLNTSEKLSNDNIVDIFYETLVLQYNIAENKYRDKSFKIYSNDKTAVLFIFFVTNNADKLINKAYTHNVSRVDSIQDTILLFIHNKDGKKHLL